MARKSKLLNELGTKIGKINLENNVEDIPIDFIIELKKEIYDNVFDYRADIAYQPLENIIMITFISLMANCNEWTEIHEFGIIHEKWFSKFLDLKFGIPSLSTIRKTMCLVDPNELETSCVNLIIRKVNELTDLFIKDNNNDKDILAYDGKVCRGSGRDNTVNGKVKPVNAMTAFNVSKDLPLATKFIDEKTNEIPTGPELIKLLDLTNTISTFDALNTQEKTIEAIFKKSGDYVAALKGNQHNFYDSVVEYFNDNKLYEEAYNRCHYEEKEYAHGCQEKRIYIMTENINWLSCLDKWRGLKSICIVIREYEIKGEYKKDIRYFISSLGCDEIKNFARAVRDEWGIENNLHWHLDVTFKEDANKTANKNGQANLNILRKLALNLLKLVQPLYNKSLKLIRFKIGQNFEEEIVKVLGCLNIEELRKATNR